MKPIEKDCINLTNELLGKYWQKDYQSIIDYCMDDVCWIGARQDEFKTGRDETKADFMKAVVELQPCHLINAEYHALSYSSKSCTVTGRYIVTTDADADYFLQAQQRCTFIWIKTGDGLRITHIHVSNPLGELKLDKNEAFPNTIGKMAHRYLMNHYNNSREDIRLTISGNNGSLHFVKMSEILYISAMGKEAVISTLHGDILAKTGISQLADQSKNNLLSVHRSYLVNPDYISSIERYNVIMTNNTKIPIPAKKYTELRNTLMQMHIS